jgi:hypothetical protein
MVEVEVSGRGRTGNVQGNMTPRPNAMSGRWRAGLVSDLFCLRSLYDPTLDVMRYLQERCTMYV